MSVMDYWLAKPLRVHTSVNPSMTDQGNEEINKISATVQDTDSVSATVSREISTETIREYLEEKPKIPIALLLTSVRVEAELGRKLKDHIDKIDSDPQLSKFVKEQTGLAGDDLSLGTYVSYAVKTGVASQYSETLQQLASHRNNLVHDQGYWESTYSNPKIRDEVVGTVEESLEFLDE